jgi:hypothetical protein
MKVVIHTLAIASVFLVPTGFSCAGIQVILVPPANSVEIRLEACDHATEATLHVPKALLGKARRTDSEAKKPRAALRPSAIAAGVGLTLCLAVPALLFARPWRRPGGKRLAVILVLAGLMLVGRCSLHANAPAPFDLRRPTPKLSLSGGNVTVKIAADGGAIRLVVPKERLAEWAARLKATENIAP